MKAIILAGGEGARLRPFTEAVPKPMLPIGHKPLLEINIEYLKCFGVDQIILAIHYLKDSISHYFGNGERFGISIKYSREKTLLGTAGAVKQAAGNIGSTFAVVLGDGLADVDYRDLLNYHKENQATGTMVIFEKKMEIPYGVLQMDTASNNVIKDLDEKPELSFQVNTGIVLLEPQSLRYIEPHTYTPMIELFLRMKNHGHKVIAYHHKGNWVDIGQDVSQYLETNTRILTQELTFDRTLTNIIFGISD